MLYCYFNYWVESTGGVNMVVCLLNGYGYLTSWFTVAVSGVVVALAGIAFVALSIFVLRKLEVGGTQKEEGETELQKDDQPGG